MWLKSAFPALMEAWGWALRPDAFTPRSSNGLHPERLRFQTQSCQGPERGRGRMALGPLPPYLKARVLQGASPVIRSPPVTLLSHLSVTECGNAQRQQKARTGSPRRRPVISESSPLVPNALHPSQEPRPGSTGTAMSQAHWSRGAGAGGGACEVCRGRRGACSHRPGLSGRMG